MSSFHKMQKNINDYYLDQLYKNMTPEEYRKGVRLAVQTATNDLTHEYNLQLKKLCDDYNNQIHESIRVTIDTLSIEFIYELANKLECFSEQPENLEQKIDLVQNIYENIMNRVQNYANIKENDEIFKEFQRKRELIKKTFNIFEDGGKNE